MTFIKPTNITYTQMAIWVDQNGGCPECDEQTLVEYLFHLVYNKAQQAALFRDYEQYDDFSIYCVSRLISRLQNKQDAPVKSIVNYIKTILYPWHADYVRQFCSGSPDLEVTDFDLSDFSDYLVDITSEYDTHAYSVGCLNITHTIRNHLKKIPHKKNSSEWSNIYASCLLTLHDRISAAVSLSHKNLAVDDPNLFNRIVRGLKTRPPILYHLEESMSNYISVLVNELIHAISAELTFTFASKISVSACLKNMVIAASNDEDD